VTRLWIIDALGESDEIVGEIVGLIDGGHTSVFCSVGQSLDTIGRHNICTDGLVAEALKYSIYADRIRDETILGPCAIF
jgi:hypothetical protein